MSTNRAFDQTQEIINFITFQLMTSKLSKYEHWFRATWPNPHKVL